MTPTLLIHLTGLLALALNVSGLVRTCDRSLRRTTGVASAIWALNNFLLGAHSAALLSVVSAGRQASASYLEGHSAQVRRWTCTVFLVLTVGVGAFTWHGWTTLLTTSGSLLATYAMFYMRGMALRLAMLTVSALWMYNAWAYNSWEQAIGNLVTAGAAVYGAWRLHKGQ